MPGGQLHIDFDYDERTARLAVEIAILLIPRMAPGTTSESTKLLADRIAMLAEKRYKDAWEPSEPIRCHTCDAMTVKRSRVRVAVCVRCSIEGRTPGSSG